MNALSHLGHAAQLIREADPERAGRWILYVFQQALKLKPANHQDGDDYVVAMISSHEIRKGVTSKKWDSIDSQIRIAQKKGVLE